MYITKNTASMKICMEDAVNLYYISGNVKYFTAKCMDQKN